MSMGGTSLSLFSEVGEGLVDRANYRRRLVHPARERGALALRPRCLPASATPPQTQRRPRLSR
jgi:hypothetical protein